MKRPDPGMHRDAFRQALRGNPDANKVGMKMLLENNPNTYTKKPKRKRTR